MNEIMDLYLKVVVLIMQKLVVSSIENTCSWNKYQFVWCIQDIFCPKNSLIYCEVIKRLINELIITCESKDWRFFMNLIIKYMNFEFRA